MSDMKLAAKIEERVKARDGLAHAIQNDITALSIKIKKFVDQDLETYKMLVGPDCLYNDSPISMMWTHHWLKQFMIKKDMDFIGYNLDGKHTIKPFQEMVYESSRWVMRFSKEQEPKKTGIEAIL